MIALTARQAEHLDFIRRTLRTRGFPPTLRETMAAMGLRSTNAVSDVLHALERKGWIETANMKSRGIRLVVPPGCCQACGQKLPP